MAEALMFSDQFIFKTAVVGLPIEAVWQMWTTHQGLKSFIGYDNNICMLPGGAYEIYFNKEANAGEKGSETCKVLSYLPHKMLSFSWNAPPEYPYVRNNPYKTWVVLAFETTAEGLTKVELYHLGWPIGEAWDEVYHYFDVAWGKVMVRFIEVCSNISKNVNSDGRA